MKSPIPLSCLTLFLTRHVTLSFQQPQPVQSRRHFSTTAAAAAAKTTTTTLPPHDTPATLPAFASADDYLAYMATVATPLPQGFAIGTADGTFTSVEAPSLGPLPIRATVLHLTEGPTEAWAAVFTQNQFPGAPIHIGRARLHDGHPLQAIVINNKVSNVCAGGDGVAAAELVCDAVADALHLASPHHVVPSSTGVIGWRLPAAALADTVVPQAVRELQAESALPAAQAICTTDRYPKVRSRTLANGARVVGIAKGAGMVEPNLATMLCYILTDAKVPKAKLQSMLSDTVNGSFNSISVDGDESTSDTTVLVSSERVDDTDLDEFQSALDAICQGLAQDLVRNGEGTGHVMRVQIDNFPGTDQQARQLGRHVVNSPLFKCAIAGNDPNIGRLAGAVGSFMGKFFMGADVSHMQLTMGGQVIFKNSQFVLDGQAMEDQLSAHIAAAQYDDHSDYPPHQNCVDIGIDFQSDGKGSAVVFGSDLTAEYVAINADYRS